MSVTFADEIDMIIDLYPRNRWKCLEAVKRIGLTQFIKQASVNHAYSAFVQVVGAYKQEETRGKL